MNKEDIITRDRVLPKALMAIGIVLLALCLWVLFAKALPHLQDKHHSTLSHSTHEYNEVIAGFIYLKFETADAFVANQPIRVSVDARPWKEDIRSIQLTFEGANNYFPSQLPEYPPLPIDVNDTESMTQYWQKRDEYWRELEEHNEQEREELSKGLLHLQREEDSFSGIPRFLPGHTEITYSTGGTFDVGITLTLNDGGVIGYGLGDKSYSIASVIDIAPPEVLHTIKNNNLLTGLGWLAVSLTLLTIGFTILIAVVLRPIVHITEMNRNPVADCIDSLFSGIARLLRP